MRKTTLWSVFALLLLTTPMAMMGQGFRDLDAAMSGIERGFARGEAQPIIAGVGDGDQVMLDFSGLIGESGFFGRDQAAYMLDELFSKAKPMQFQQTSARKVSAEGQYHIQARWTLTRGGREEQKDLYITLRQKGDRWTVASIRSGGK